MEEAVEICRLRLFLKLAAQLESYDQIEPLPDIDFNIQAGNTLVGFTSAASVRRAMEIDLKGQARMLYPEDEEALERIEAKAISIARDFRNFQWVQTEFGMGHEELAESKQDLQSKLSDLRSELNALLAKEYGVDANEAVSYQSWQASHRPFHWFVEFYAIMSQGGFDIIIGNPPYKDLRSVVEYKVRNLASTTTKNLYPLVMERCLQFSRHEGRLGFIVPVSSISTEGYKTLQDILFRYSGHFSSFDDRPSRLFDGLQHIQLTIHLIRHSDNSTRFQNVTECYRWQATERDFLFGRLAYQKVEQNYLVGCLPKLSRRLEHSLLEKVWHDEKTIGEQTTRTGHVTYYSRKVHNFLQALDFVPVVYDGTGNLRPPTED